MSDEIRAAAERLRGIEGPTFHGINGKRHISEREYADAVTLARAYLAEHPPTPDGPPAAAPERKAGERYIVVQPEGSRAVYANDADGHPHCIGYCGDAADADLLVSGRARLRAMEAALREFVLEQSASGGEPCFCKFADGDFREWVHSGRCLRARAALGAGPGGGT